MNATDAALLGLIGGTLVSWLGFWAYWHVRLNRHRER